MSRSTATRRARSNRRSRPVFRHAVHWTGAVSVSNPLALTRAYAARFAALGGLSFTGDARTLHRVASALARRDGVRSARCRRGRHRARSVAAGCARSARHKTAARGQARLSPPLPRARQCRARPAGARCRERLLPGADGAGHPADHRRRVRRARRAADAGAVRAPAAGGARTVSRSASRSRQQQLGSARVRALPIPVRSSDARRVTPDYGSPAVMRIGD